MTTPLDELMALLAEVDYSVPPESFDNSCKSSKPPKKKFMDRLDFFGMDIPIFEYYRKTFIGYQPHFWKKYLESEWLQQKNVETGRVYPPSKYAIMDHLEWQYWITCEMPIYTDHFAIDLDMKAGTKDLRNRYDWVVSILPDPVVFQSSNSGGLHLYYFLERAMHRDAVRRILKTEIRAANMKETPGQIEFFPGYLRKLRLPFGKDNFLLDNRSLDHLCLNLPDSLRYIQAHPRMREIHFSSSDMKSNESTRIGRKMDDITSPIKKFEYGASTDVNILTAEPIAQYGTRNATQMKLIRECASSGMSEQETVDSILLWYRSHKHITKDWEHNPTQVERELRLAVRNWYQKLKRDKPLAQLSVGDVQFILNVTAGLKVKGKFNKEALDYQQFLFHIFRFFKGMNKTELSLPSRAAEGFPGSSHRTVADRFRFCTGNGILIERGHQNYVSHISRKFEITYRFKEEGGISSFVDGLYLIMSEREIRGLYTRRIAKKIVTMHKR